MVFFSLSTVTNAVLQGLNRLDVPVRHAFLSLAVHIILVEVFLMIFHMGIFSVVFANILFAFMMCLLNGRSIVRYAGYRQEYKKTVILPFVCSLLMGAAAWSIYKGLVFFMPGSFKRRPFGNGCAGISPGWLFLWLYMGCFS